MIGRNNSPDYTSTPMQLEAISQGKDTIPPDLIHTISCSNVPFTNNYESYLWEIKLTTNIYVYFHRMKLFLCTTTHHNREFF